MAPLSASLLHLLSGLGERHSDERRAQRFRIHFHTGAPQVVICPDLHIRRLNLYCTTRASLATGGLNGKEFLKGPPSPVSSRPDSRHCWSTAAINLDAVDVVLWGAIRTVLNDRMANKLAIIVENPGARQLCAIKPNFSSARQITSSPCFQSQDGMFSKYACGNGAELLALWWQGWRRAGQLVQS